MKTNLLRLFTSLAAAALILQVTPQVLAAEPSAKTMETSKGTVTSVNADSGSVTLKQLVRTRTFRLADDCVVQVVRNEMAKPIDLKAGMEVEIAHEKVEGVLIAHRITQVQKLEVGAIKSIDVDGHRMVLDRIGPTIHKFTIPADCELILYNGEKGALSDYKIGQRVTVHYVRNQGELIAQRIENPRMTAVGTLEAIDAATRTLVMRHGLNSKRFSLAKDCQIVVESQPDRTLEDLRIGQRVAIDYRDANGVLIAMRVATVAYDATELPIGE